MFSGQTGIGDPRKIGGDYGVTSEEGRGGLWALSRLGDSRVLLERWTPALCPLSGTRGHSCRW